jgi:hypothetical protein
VKKTAIQAAATYVFENVQEGLQDVTLPTVQSLAALLNADVPGVDWDKESQEFWGSRLDVAIGVLPLTLLGIGFNTMANRDSVLKLLKDNRALAQVGLPEQSRIAILEKAQAGDVDGANQLLRESWSQRDPALAAEYLPDTATQASIVQEKAREANDLGISMTLSGGKWTVRTRDGVAVALDNPEAAQALQYDLMQAASEDAAAANLAVLEGTVDLVRRQTGKDTTLTIGSESKELVDGKIRVQTPREEALGEYREITSGEELDRVRAQAESTGIGAGEIGNINGSNEEFKDAVGKTAVAIMVNRSKEQLPVSTALHEGAEAIYKAKVDPQAALVALRALQGALPAQSGPRQKDSADETSLRQRLQDAVDGKLDDEGVREITVEMLVADQIAKDRRGQRTGWAAGTITRAIDAELMAGTKATSSALMKLRQFMKAARTWFRGVVGVVKAMDKARLEGKDLSAWDNFADELLGLQESKFAKAVESEAEGMLGAGPARKSFSLSKSSRSATAKDAEYLAAVEAGDMETAQRMVDEAAKAAGYDGVGFRSSENEDLKPFPGNLVFVSKDEQLAKWFGVPRKVYLKQGINPTTNWKIMSQFFEQFPIYRAGARSGFETGALPFWTGQWDLQKWLDDQGIEYDSLFFVESGMEASAALKAINQLKSADPVTRDESGNVVPLSQRFNPADDRITFSLTPSRRMALTENRLAVVLKQDSDQARRYAERANARLARLKSTWAGVPAPMSKEELDLAQKRITEQRRDELETIYTGEVEYRLGGILNQPEMAKLTEHPLADFLRTSKSRRHRYYGWRLELPSKWRKRQLEQLGYVGGDYDGAGDLPKLWFQGDESPDTLAKEAFSQGASGRRLIKDDTVEALWDGIHEMLEEVARNRGELAKAQQELKEAKAKAKEEAEYEGRAWRFEQDAAQETLRSPRTAALRDVATVQAVVMAMPAEARAKLPTGLYAQVAGVTSDSAYANMMTKVIREVEKANNAYWKAKNIESMNELVMLGQGKSTPGKKPRGTATPEVHRYFKEVAKVVEAKPLALAAMRLGMSKILNGNEDVDLDTENNIVNGEDADTEQTYEEAELTQQINIIDLWGDFANKSVADQSAALEAGWETYRAGRNAWWQKEEERLAAVRESAQAVLDAGGLGSTGQLLDTRYKRGQIASSVGGTFVDVGQFMARLVGDIPLVKRWEATLSANFVAKEASLGRMRKKWEAALEAAMPGISKSQRERRFFELHTKRAIEVELTEEKMNALINAKERKKLEGTGWTPEQITDKARMTEGEALTALFTWGQPRYRASMERSGFTAPIIDQIEQALSPETKYMMNWMKQQMQELHPRINAVMLRMAGIDLPNDPNYWPGRFYSAGVEQEVDVMGQSVVGKGFADGFLKERKTHAAYVKLEDAFATFWGHVNQTEHWIHLAETVREMRGVFRNPQVKRGVEAARGKQALIDMNAWLDVLEANGTQGDSGGVEKVLNWALGKLSVGRLAWNPFSIVRQVPAMFNVGLDAGLTPGMLFKGAGSILSNPERFRDVYEELFASDVIFARLEGGMSPEIRNALNEFWKSGPGMWQSAIDKGMEVLGFTDAMFTTIGGVVAYEAKAIELERAGLSAAEAHQQAMVAAQEAMRDTAQPTTVNKKSLMETRQRNAIKSSVMMFLSDGRQKWAFYQESIIDIVNNGRKAKKSSWNRVLWTWLVIGPSAQIITSAIRDSMDGGEDEEWIDAKNWTASDFIISSLLGPLRGFFFAGQFVETLMDRAAGRRLLQSNSAGVTDIPQEVADDALRGLGYMTDDKEQTPEQYANLALSIMSNVGGAPGMIAGGIKKVIKLADQE